MIEFEFRAVRLVVGSCSYSRSSGRGSSRSYKSTACQMEKERESRKFSHFFCLERRLVVESSACRSTFNVDHYFENDSSF